MTTEYDEAKLTELSLYIADRMKNNPSFGATMLNKVLYFADFSSYEDTGSPITGAEYMHLKQGPVPRRMLPVLKALQSAGDAEIQTAAVGPYRQKRLVARRNASMGAFTPAEVERVDQMIDLLKKSTATWISNFTHRSPAWQATEEGETIPYFTVFLKEPSTSAEDIAKAHDLVAAGL